ncbi:MAG TPA: hypothetical protein VIY07_11035 [Pseudolabrys sp.]
MPTSAQLERKAERARERLSDRIADLRYHVSPTTVASDLLGAMNARNLGDEVLPILAKQARNNPIASLLIAAGVGWLIFSEVRGPIAKSLGLPKNLDLSKTLGLTASRRSSTRGRKKRRTTTNSKAAGKGRNK